MDDDFLETRLFDPEHTKGKRVIHIASERAMIDEYEALRKEKRRCAEEGTLTDEAETEIALCLGRLFCYSTRRSIVKDIDLNIVVGAPTREECTNKMHILIEDFRGWIEAVGREVLAD